MKYPNQLFPRCGRWIKPQLYLAVVVLLFGGCYPNGPDYVDELDVVYTNYDDSFEFATRFTYSIPDSIPVVDDIDLSSGEDPEFVDDVYAQVILNQIESNMNNLGWAKVGKNNNPDVIILASAMSTTTLYYYYDWSYWGWWGYPGYGPGWGWWYPGYYPPTVSGYRSGSLLIQMTNPSDIGVNDNIPVVWTAAVNGLLEGSKTSINERLRNTIDQAFLQSPYIQLQ